MKGLMKTVVVFKILLPAVFVSAFIAGCGKDAAKAGKTVITWVVDAAPNREKEMDTFEAENPNIDVQLNYDTGPEIILTRIIGGNPPDVFAIYNPSSFLAFVRRNALLDLTPYMERYGIKLNEFWPALKTTMVYDGKVYGLPANTGPHVLIYNKELFDKAGVAYPTDKWTWDDLVNNGKKLVTKTEKNGVVRYENFAFYCEQPLLFVRQNGGRMFSSDGKKCLLDSPEALGGWKFYYDLMFTHNIMPSPEQQSGLDMGGSGSWGYRLNLFAVGRVAMLVQGRWMCMEYRQNPKLKWDIAAVPRGKKRLTTLASKVYGIPYNCKHKEEAFRFLAYEVSKKSQLLITSTGDGIPSRIEFAKAPEFLSDPRYPDEKRNQLYLDEMQYAVMDESSPYIESFEIDRIMQEELDKMNNGLQKSDETAKAVTRRINEIIQKNLKGGSAGETKPAGKGN